LLPLPDRPFADGERGRASICSSASACKRPSVNLFVFEDLNGY
jgi:hypothetical protein